MENLMSHFLEILIKDKNYDGDLVEFGTGHGYSTTQIAQSFKKNKIFTFDGFQGLPKTNKIVPRGTPWEEGMLKSDFSETKKKLSIFENVIVTQCMTWELQSPEHYGIKKISAANLDLDLYEGTLDALRFIDKCEWNNLLIRFDDWGFYRNTNQIEKEVWEHEKAAFFDFIGETNYKYEFFENINNIVDNRQVVLKIWR
jgi:hypothetical protein